MRSNKDPVQPKIIKFLKKETSLKKKKINQLRRTARGRSQQVSQEAVLPCGLPLSQVCISSFCKSDLTLSSSRCNKSNSDVDIREGF